MAHLRLEPTIPLSNNLHAVSGWSCDKHIIGLKLNGTDLLQAYACDLNILGENTDTIQKSREVPPDTSNEVGLKVNSEKTKYKLSCQKAGQKHGIKIANRSFEGVENFKYLETTLTDQNCKHEEIKSRLNSGNACSNQSRVFCLPACCPGM
jgi:hypothetical protein